MDRRVPRHGPHHASWGSRDGSLLPYVRVSCPAQAPRTFARRVVKHMGDVIWRIGGYCSMYSQIRHRRLDWGMLVFFWSCGSRHIPLSKWSGKIEVGSISYQGCTALLNRECRPTALIARSKRTSLCVIASSKFGKQEDGEISSVVLPLPWSEWGDRICFSQI